MNPGDTGHGYPILLPGEGEGLPVPGPPEREAVAFEAEDSGVEELTWGQWSIWEAMARHGAHDGLAGLEPARGVELQQAGH